MRSGLRLSTCSAVLVLCACLHIPLRAQQPTLAADINETIVSIPVIVAG